MTSVLFTFSVTVLVFVDFFDDEDFEQNYLTARDYVNYVLYLRKKENKEKLESDLKLKEDIPFIPRHDF